MPITCAVVLKVSDRKDGEMRAVCATWFSRILSSLTSTIDSRIPAAKSAPKTLYLTFDDGPTKFGTAELLDVLAKFSVPATFFLLGRNVERHPQLVRRILDLGHDVGNHSHSHIDAWKSSRRQTLADFRRCSNVLKQTLGVSVRLLRPPFGRVTPALAHWAIRRKQRLTLWDVMPPDFQPGISTSQIVRKMTRGVRNGSIICLHDNEQSRSVTPAALETALPQLQAEGWKFARLPASSEPPCVGQ